MKRASSRVVRSSNRAMSGRSSRVTMLGDAVGMAGDDMAAEFVADLQRALEVEPGADASSAWPWSCASVSAAASTSNQVLPPSATPEPTTVRQTPLQAIEAPSAMVARS